MKMYGFLCVAVGISMLLTPMAAIDFDNTESEKITESQTQVEETVKPAVTTQKKEEDTISVFMTTENETLVMDMRDYIIGAVAAEVPASYNAAAEKHGIKVVAGSRGCIFNANEVQLIELIDFGSSKGQGDKGLN